MQPNDSWGPNDGSDKYALSPQQREGKYGVDNPGHI